MLDTEIRDLARGKNFAALTVIPKSGHPMTHVMWVDADDNHVLINTELGRAKATAMDNDDRVTVTVMRCDNPYHYAEVRGRVVGTDRPARKPPITSTRSPPSTPARTYGFGPTDKRIIYRIEPLHQRTM